MAISTTLLFGRIGALAGSNVAGVLLESSCDGMFIIAAIFLFACAMISFFVSTKSSQAENWNSIKFIHKKFRSEMQIKFNSSSRRALRSIYKWKLISKIASQDSISQFESAEFFNLHLIISACIIKMKFCWKWFSLNWIHSLYTLSRALYQINKYFWGMCRIFYHHNTGNDLFVGCLWIKWKCIRPINFFYYCKGLKTEFFKFIQYFYNIFTSKINIFLNFSSYFYKIFKSFLRTSNLLSSTLHTHFSYQKHNVT